MDVRFCVTLVSLRKRVHARASPSPSSWKKKKNFFFLYRRNQQPPSCRGLEIRISIRRYFLISKRRVRGDVRRQLSARDAAGESRRSLFWRKILEFSGISSATNPPPSPIRIILPLISPFLRSVSVFKPREGEPSDGRQHRRDVRKKL